MSAGPGTGSTGLLRQLGLVSATCAVVTAMIGSGIFTTTGFLGNSLQDPWLVLLVWLLGGGLALLGAISYLELAALLPRAGGEYAFVAAAFGPFWGFLTGWSLFLWGFSAPIALCALTFTKYAAAFVPALGPEGDEALPLVGGSVRIGNLVAALLIVAIAGFHYWRVSSGVRLQNLLTFGKVAAILLLAALALLSGKTRGAGLVEKGAVPPAAEIVPLAAEGLVFVFLAYSGWNAAVYLAAEVREPDRNLPRAVIGGTILVTAIYLLVNVVYFLALPAASMEASQDIAGRAAEVFFGQAGRTALSAVVMLTQLGTISVIVMSGSRVYFAMGEDGVVWRRLASVVGAGHTPRAAVALQGGIAALMALGMDFLPLLRSSGTVLMLFSALAVAGLFVLRRCASGKTGAAGPGTGRDPEGGGAAGGAADGAQRAPAGPRRLAAGVAIPGLYILFSVAASARAAATAPWQTAFLLLSAAAAVPLYVLFRRSLERGSQA